uniref:DnaJ domain-containing protein n=1 Tax=Candidatus Desulfatibia profunda TaxID=2841695 RepID=A0A8J6NUJ5_9BACT|nr:DnaJ domain-containing protein [Candidatus Desulfatibia profunda]
MVRILLAFLAIAYALIPYDILPDFIVGWGWIDDLIILWLAWQFFNAQKKKRAGYQSYDNSRQAFGNERNKQHSKKKPGAESGFDESSGPIDPYTVLNIERNASPEEIKQAYRKLANQYHPDKVQHLGEEFRKLAEKRFKEIEAAYRQLTKDK